MVSVLMEFREMELVFAILVGHLVQLELVASVQQEDLDQIVQVSLLFSFFFFFSSKPSLKTKRKREKERENKAQKQTKKTKKQIGICENCNNGECNSGLEGSGKCDCLPGWDSSTNCSSCADGFVNVSGSCQSEPTTSQF